MLRQPVIVRPNGQSMKRRELVLIEDEFVGVDFFANTTAAQIVLVGDLIRQIEHHNAAPVRRSAA